MVEKEKEKKKDFVLPLPRIERDVSCEPIVESDKETKWITNKTKCSWSSVYRRCVQVFTRLHLDLVPSVLVTAGTWSKKTIQRGITTRESQDGGLPKNMVVTKGNQYQNIHQPTCWHADRRSNASLQITEPYPKDWNDAAYPVVIDNQKTMSVLCSRINCRVKDTWAV